MAWQVLTFILDYTDKEREILAERSRSYKCPQCGPTALLLKETDEDESEVKSEIDKYSKEVAISKPASNNNGKTVLEIDPLCDEWIYKCV